MLRPLVVRCRFAATAAASSSSSIHSANAAERLIQAAKAQLAPLPHGCKSRPPSPAASEVSHAVRSVTNGYLAWSLYVAIRQCNAALSGEDLEMLVGSMLKVDVDLHGDLAARRALSVIDEERQHGRQPSTALLAHGAAACALRGLPDLAEALCAEAELHQATALDGASSAGTRPHLGMRASLIAACGTAQQLGRAFEEYRALETRTGLSPPGSLPVLALMNACVASDDLDAAFEIFDQARRGQRFSVRAGALAPLLRGCAQRGAVERAMEVLAIADTFQVDVHATAVREFSRAGGAEFLGLARHLHQEARATGKHMPTGSTTKLARAFLLANDADAAADVLIGSPRDTRAHRATDASGPPEQHDGEQELHDLNSALDLLHSLARQERQRDQLVRDKRGSQHQDLDGPIEDSEDAVI